MNHSLTIRMARLQDLPRILEIYAIARKFMAENGNPSQWKRDYLAEEAIPGRTC